MLQTNPDRIYSKLPAKVISLDARFPHYPFRSISSHKNTHAEVSKLIYPLSFEQRIYGSIRGAIPCEDPNLVLER